MAAKSYHLPNEVANISRCSVCEEYLSCGPIMGHDGNFICGRCGKNDRNALMQVALEKMMAFFVFPCRYDKFGCKQQVLFNTSMQHERICRYRTVPCPSLLENRCYFPIPVLNLYTHCVEFHNNLITNDGDFKINVDQNASCNLVMLKDNITVIIKYFYNSKSKCLQLDVASASVIEELICYKIRILSALLEEDVNINLPEKQCTVYESYTILSTDSIKIEIDKYLGLFSNPSSLIFKIFPVAAAAIPEGSKNECQPLSSIALVKNNLCVNDADGEEESDQLIDITDMFCYNSKCTKLSYPLYYHPEFPNEKFCFKCRGVCRTKYVGSCANLSDKPYPCPYEGCLFFGSFKRVIKHMKHCKYATFLCRIDGCEHVLSLNETYIRINHLKTHATYCTDPEEIIINLIYILNLKKPVDKFFTYIRNVFILFKVEYTKSWNFYCNLPSGIEMEITLYDLPGCNGNYSKRFVGYRKVHFNPQVSPALQCCKDSCLMIKINKV